MKEISMRKIKEIIRLSFEKKLSISQIADSLNLSKSSIHRCLTKAKQANLSWPLPEGTTDESLEKTLYPQDFRLKEIPLPDFAYIFKELKRKGVTLMQLWKEYKEAQPEGYGYSQYCLHYNGYGAHSYQK